MQNCVDNYMKIKILFVEADVTKHIDVSVHENEPYPGIWVSKFDTKLKRWCLCVFNKSNLRLSEAEPVFEVSPVVYNICAFDL